MKLLRRITVSALIVLFISTGLCFGQDTVRQTLTTGVEYAAQGKFKEAKVEFEKALKVDPFYESARSLKLIEEVNEGKIKTNAAIRYFKGVGYGFKGQNDQAIADFTKAIEINPRFAYAYYNRGNAYGRKGHYDQAISDFTKAIEIDSRFAMPYFSRGYAYGCKGQHDKAISDYNKAIEINPRYAEAHSNRGVAYDAKGNMKKACSDWKRACELGDCRSWGMLNKIRCLGK